MKAMSRIYHDSIDSFEILDKNCMDNIEKRGLACRISYEEVYLPNVGKTLVFVFNKYPEKDFQHGKKFSGVFA